MPRPVKTLEPVVIEAARSISSNSLSLTSPPSSTTDSAWGVPINHANNQSMNQLTAWGLQWDSIDEQVYDKDEINLSMSVRRPRARNDTPEPDHHANIGFMDAAMKEDGFVPLNEPINQSLNQTNGRETRANESTPPFTTITSVNNQSPEVQSINRTINQANAEFVCPCCGIGTPGGIAYHEHVTQCYIGRFMESVKSNQQTNPSPSNTEHTQNPTNNPSNTESNNQNSIHTLRSAVSNLDLHERIGLMEAFFRLSRTAGSNNQSNKESNNQTSNRQTMMQDNQPTNQSMGDEAVISLLFSPTDEKKSEKPVADQSGSQLANQMTYRSRAPSPPVATSYQSVNSSVTQSIHHPRSPARSPSASPSYNRSINQRHCLTPAMSPSINQSVNQHTCLTPALNRWELDGKEDAYLQEFSLVDHDQSAPLTPPSAFKRARALSQPHVAYNDHIINQSTNHSPHMRSYSPVRVHIQAPSMHQSINPSWNLIDQNLSVNSLSARRHSIGLMNSHSTNSQSIRQAINYPGISAVDGLTFNAGVVNSPPSTQSSPTHQSVNQSIAQHRLHQYLPVQPKYKRGKPMDSTRQSA